jgi:4-hydroxybutyrate dehydrogenase
MPSTFSFPTTTLFEVGARRELRGWLGKLGCAHPLVVTDAALAKTNAFALLAASLTGMDAVVFSEVRNNPEEADVEGAWRAYRDHGCDGVIAFGGGSALDVGKSVRLRVRRPGQALAQFDFTQDWSGLAPLIAIPTTAGTGSEVGRSAVIIMEQRKRVLFHPALLASLVILDPEFTRELPPKLTAATGADALTHCIESFTSPVFNPLCDGIALEGIHLIGRALVRAVKDGGDLEARGLMQVAAAMGGIAFQKDLGAAHSLAHPLSSLCGLHHGLANALCLPWVMDFNAERKPGVYRRIGIALGLSHPSDAATIAAVRALLAEIGIAPGLRAQGVDETKLDALAEQAFADSCHATNPVPVTREDLRNLYQRAL